MKEERVDADAVGWAPTIGTLLVDDDWLCWVAMISS
jgi:hypothetical protein